MKILLLSRDDYVRYYSQADDKHGSEYSAAVLHSTRRMASSVARTSRTAMIGL